MQPDATAAPCIAVATVVFNGAVHIARTLQSTLTQDYPNVECIVIDGGSTDGTREVVAGFGDRIHVFLSEPDGGIYDAMNKAVALASGEYLLFMNCGDVFAGPGALSAAAATLAPGGGDQVVFGGWERQEADGRRVARRPSLEAGLFNHQAILYSRSLHARHGGYVAVRGFTAADYLFFATLVASGAVRCTVADAVIAVIDVSGVSAGPQTLSQKVAIDYLCGRAGRLKLLAVLAAHPIYWWTKRWLRWLR